jgi:protein-tyrosine phosphatase
MADVVLRALMADHLGTRLVVSSAGTGNWHDGEPMDPRARRALEAAGYHDHGHVARALVPAALDHLDMVVGLDRRHVQIVRGLAAGRPTLSPARIVLLREFDPTAGGSVDVPDPYYGDDAEFGRCLAMVEAGCRGMVRQLEPHLAGA